MAQPDANRGLGATGSSEVCAVPNDAVRNAVADAQTGVRADVSSGEAPRTNNVLFGFAPWIIFDVVASPVRGSTPHWRRSSPPWCSMSPT